MSKIIAVVSGGMDSVTMAHHLKEQGNELQLLSVDYGQRHRKEHDYAAEAAERLGAVHQVADLSALGAMFHGSSLTDPSVDVPEQTWNTYGESPNIVPNRNALLLAAAYAIAVVEQAEAVAIGVMAGDVASVPDSTPAFLEAFDAMERIATRGYAHPDLTLLAPLAGMDKSGVVLLGEELGVDWTRTWTCFRGGEIHCGRCASCWERQDAFAGAAVNDPTTYQEKKS
ncbi:7-cyano-7-deazaguanine synthase [Kitasatospora sp. KL5]|uniref:7-cyano-7-deazaguanine synthase n=1 Tax=Kitasatospora sp. KL5 TaxID=3425125 RepID=UPI003D6E930B